MINGIIFDLDNTLYDYDLCNNIALEFVGKYLCSRMDITRGEFEQSYNLAKKKVKERLKNVASMHNRLLYMQAFLENYGTFNVESALYCYNMYWNTFLEHMELDRQAEAVLSNCRDRGLKIGICTDLTVHIQFRKVVKLGIAPLIDCIVTSEEAGAEKPDLKMFVTILEKLGIGADECLMVGDDFEKDIMGAGKAGMKAIWYNPKGLPPQGSCDYTEVRELSEILQRWEEMQ